METKIRTYKIDTQTILEIINYNILNSTALYDYNIRSYSSRAILEEKIAKQFPVIIAELDGLLWFFRCIVNLDFIEAYKFVEHSVYVNNDSEGKGGKILLQINSTGKKTRITH
jgi:phosphinothricin acetyltransferase